MTGYREISPYELEMSNAFRAIGREWMLICARDGERVNAMTASWGFFGELWSRPSAVCFIRPQRYTHELTENAEYMTLCLFGEGSRRELGYFGRASGRNGNKAEACGLSYEDIEHNGCRLSYVSGASVALVCRRVYRDRLDPEKFDDGSVIGRCYPERDFHTVYVCEVETAFVRE